MEFNFFDSRKLNSINKWTRRDMRVCIFVALKQKEKNVQTVVDRLLLTYDCETVRQNHNSDREYEKRDKHLIEGTRTFYT